MKVRTLLTMSLVLAGGLASAAPAVAQHRESSVNCSANGFDLDTRARTRLPASNGDTINYTGRSRQRWRPVACDVSEHQRHARSFPEPDGSEPSAPAGRARGRRYQPQRAEHPDRSGRAVHRRRQPRRHEASRRGPGRAAASCTTGQDNASNDHPDDRSTLSEAVDRRSTRPARSTGRPGSAERDVHVLRRHQHETVPVTRSRPVAVDDNVCARSSATYSSGDANGNSKLDDGRGLDVHLHDAAPRRRRVHQHRVRVRESMSSTADACRSVSRRTRGPSRSRPPPVVHPRRRSS